MSIPPRIRGRVGQAEPGQGVDGKWFFTLEVATLYGETIGEPFGPFGPYDSKELAQDALRGAARLAAEAVEKGETGKVSGKYLDIKNGGVMRDWDEQ